MAADPLAGVQSRIEQCESVEYLFYPGEGHGTPPFETVDVPHAPNPHENSIWFKTYE